MEACNDTQQVLHQLETLNPTYNFSYREKDPSHLLVEGPSSHLSVLNLPQGYYYTEQWSKITNRYNTHAQPYRIFSLYPC